jgi:hypothetical protein
LGTFFAFWDFLLFFDLELGLFLRTTSCKREAFGRNKKQALKKTEIEELKSIMPTSKEE